MYVLPSLLGDMDALEDCLDRVVLLPRRKVDTMDFSPDDRFMDLLLFLSFFFSADSASTIHSRLYRDQQVERSSFAWCIFIYVCMYVYIYVWMSICMYVYEWVYVCMCMYECMYVQYVLYECICMYVCMYVWTQTVLTTSAYVTIYNYLWQETYRPRCWCWSLWHHRNRSTAMWKRFRGS